MRFQRGTEQPSRTAHMAKSIDRKVAEGVVDLVGWACTWDEAGTPSASIPPQ